MTPTAAAAAAAAAAEDKSSSTGKRRVVHRSRPVSKPRATIKFGLRRRREGGGREGEGGGRREDEGGGKREEGGWRREEGGGSGRAFLAAASAALFAPLLTYNMMYNTILIWYIMISYYNLLSCTIPYYNTYCELLLLLLLQLRLLLLS